MKSISFSIVLTAIFAGVLSVAARAQNELGDLRFTAFGGSAYTSSSAKVPFQAGLTFDQSLYATHFNHVATGYLLEGGYLRPATVDAGTAFASFDAMLSRYEDSNGAQRQKAYMPFAFAGYTRLWNTTNAVNFGAGLDRAISEDHFWLRAEVNDVVDIPGGRQTIGFRLGLVFKGTLR